MSPAAIQVEKLSKRYRIGSRDARPETMIGAMASWFRSPVSNYRQLRSLSEFGDNGRDDADVIWALKDISFEIEPGEVVGIIGRNGAGKTTLLKVLSRITEPSFGRAIINGRVASLLEVGTGFHPELTGRENVFLNGTILGMSHKEVKRKFDEIVEFSEVERFLETPIKRYSSGMQVRLAFAVAAHLDPENLLVDEVLAVGDAEFQKKCIGKMEGAAKEGKTVLFVSHNMGAVSDLCNRCLLIEDGRILADGPTEDIIHRYLKENAGDQPIVSFPPIESDAYFSSLALRDDRQHLSTRFDVRKPFEVELGFNVKHRLRGLQVSISVHNFKGERIFYSSNAHDRTSSLIDEPGPHLVTAQVPGMFLPPGTYSLNVALHRPNIDLFDRRESILAFEVEETGSGRYEFSAEEMGYVLANIRWENRDKVQN